MSQRFVVTPAVGGAGHPDPAAAPDPPHVDALPILHYGREPSRYGRCGGRGGPRGARAAAASRAWAAAGARSPWAAPGWPARCIRGPVLGSLDRSPVAGCPVRGPGGGGLAGGR